MLWDNQKKSCDEYLVLYKYLIWYSEKFIKFLFKNFVLCYLRFYALNKWIFKIKIQFRFQNSQKYQDEKVTLIIYFMLWTTMIGYFSIILANYNRLWFIISGQILFWDVRYLLCLNNKIFELMFLFFELLFFELWKKKYRSHWIQIFMNVQLFSCAVDFMAV